jgi:hypothetical protein
VERTETAQIEAHRSMFAAVPDDVAEELGVRMLGLGEAIATQVRFLPQSVEVNHALGITTAAELDAPAGSTGTAGMQSRLCPASMSTPSFGAAGTSRTTHG